MLKSLVNLTKKSTTVGKISVNCEEKLFNWTPRRCIHTTIAMNFLREKTDRKSRIKASVPKEDGVGSSAETFQFDYAPSRVWGQIFYVNSFDIFLLLLCFTNWWFLWFDCFLFFLFSRDIFPDEHTPNQLFHGMPFKDIVILNLHISKNNTIMALAKPTGKFCKLNITFFLAAKSCVYILIVVLQVNWWPVALVAWMDLKTQKKERILLLRPQQWILPEWVIFFFHLTRTK